MSGNPLAEEDHYRMRVITALPQLKVFDGLTVKPREAAAAAAARDQQQADKAKGKRRGGRGSRFSWENNMSTTVKLAEKEFARLERESREREQREKLAQFQNLDVLRTKSLKEAPVSKYVPNCVKVVEVR